MTADDTGPAAQPAPAPARDGAAPAVGGAAGAGRGGQQVRTLAKQAISFLPDALRMLAATVRDPRVPTRAKVEAAGCLALLALPIDALPLVGQLEAVALVTLAIRRLVGGAGEPVLREHWRGTDAGFDLLMTLVATGLKPRKIAWRALRRRL